MALRADSQSDKATFAGDFWSEASEKIMPFVFNRLFQTTVLVFRIFPGACTVLYQFARRLGRELCYAEVQQTACD